MTGCVYCLAQGRLAPRQLLRRGRRAYLCAPLGQLVEGYLCVAPLACVPSLAALDDDTLAEVQALADEAADFLRRACGAEQLIVYEQGRGGDGARHDPLSGFPLHAHLCLLPVTPPLPPDLPARLRAHLVERFTPTPLAGLAELPRRVAGPYLYLQAPDALLVQARDEPTRAALAAARLKPLIASLGGVPERGDWRHWPGQEALDRLTTRWRQTWPQTAASTP